LEVLNTFGRFSGFALRGLILIPDLRGFNLRPLSTGTDVAAEAEDNTTKVGFADKDKITFSP